MGCRVETPARMDIKGRARRAVGVIWAGMELNGKGGGV